MILLVAGFLEILIVVDAAISRLPIVDTVTMSVVVFGLVPNGLVLALAVAYGAGAVRIAGLGLLVEQANAIESLSHVDVLCLDKTGTLTTGQHEVRELYPIGISSTDLRSLLSTYASNVSGPNRTIAAISRAYPGQKQSIGTEIPFSSEQRWSALNFGDPETRATYVLGALARQIGFEPTAPPVSGSELSGMSPAAFATAAAETMIFGRIAPDQKRALILELRRQGHHLAMIGDGVNDILALKQANVGIALGSGSPATRAVADLVLLDDSFAGVPAAIREGQRIQNGMLDILKLFLTRVQPIALVLVGTGIVGVFPLGPMHNSLLTLLTVGLPAIGLAAWARPGPSTNGSHLKTVLHFVLPAALTLTVAELGVHLFAYLAVDNALLPALGEAAADQQAIATAQTALTTFGIICGLLLLVFVEPPSEAWVGGDTLSGDRRSLFLAIGLGLTSVCILVIPVFRQFFDLVPLAGQDYLLLALVACRTSSKTRSSRPAECPRQGRTAAGRGQCVVAHQVAYQAGGARLDPRP